jgi:hypothetical protein
MAAMRAEKHEDRDFTAVISRVSGASVTEIDGLMDQLQGLRDYLRGETERVQREIAQYAQTCRAAVESTKVIADALSQWRR